MCIYLGIFLSNVLYHGVYKIKKGREQLLLPNQVSPFHRPPPTTHTKGATQTSLPRTHGLTEQAPTLTCFCTMWVESLRGTRSQLSAGPGASTKETTT